ncbi:Mesaconyl-C(4)-CoA hydratase [Castellaniella defragrans]
METETDISAELARRTAALLDVRIDASAGASVPPQWYASFFGENFGQGLMGPDGHAVTGDFLPPVPFPRRMLAGRTVTFTGSLHVGERVSRVSTIQDVQVKQGASGPLLFVRIRHSIGRTHSESEAIVEEQTVVYKQDSVPPSAPRRHPLSEYVDDEGLRGGRRWVWTMDNTLLFRYSALTYNAHRIHYDAPYATAVEHYPGLVVNGGLRQLLMWECAHRAGIAIRGSTVRNLAPVFSGNVMTLRLIETSEGWRILESEDDETVSAVMTISQE